MHNNYYFLRLLSAELKPRLIGFELAECFSQNKDELILSFFSGPKEFYIKALFHPSFASLSFPSDFKRSKKNSVDLFKVLIGLKVRDIIQHLNERSFHLEIENDYKLMFKMHGRRSNIILFQHDRLISLFNNQLKNDLEIDIRKTDRILDQSIEAFERSKENIAELFPTFGKSLEEHASKRMKEGKTLKEKWDILQSILHYLSKPELFVTSINKQTVLSFFKEGEILLKTYDALEAVNYFTQEFLTSDTFEHEKQKIIADLERKKVKSESYIQDLHERLNKIRHENKYDEMANILMANLHLIKPHSDSVELLNFYSDKPITIKLKKTLSAQKNAEEYYRKSKNQKIEIKKISENINSKVDEIKNISLQLYEIEKINQAKEFRKYLKEHSLVKEKKEQKEPVLFKNYLFEGFEILVGRNAKNNDVLTQQYAYKEDLWLHARDVSGSHVIIKYQSGKKFPKTVIQKAAELAAYYSKRKTESLCPVIVTPKKFVRKKKGAPDGSVLVEKEEVIMVEPKDHK